MIRLYTNIGIPENPGRCGREGRATFSPVRYAPTGGASQDPDRSGWFQACPATRREPRARARTRLRLRTIGRLPQSGPRWLRARTHIRGTRCERANSRHLLVTNRWPAREARRKLCRISGASLRAMPRHSGQRSRFLFSQARGLPMWCSRRACRDVSYILLIGKRGPGV